MPDKTATKHCAGGSVFLTHNPGHTALDFHLRAAVENHGGLRHDIIEVLIAGGLRHQLAKEGFGVVGVERARADQANLSGCRIGAIDAQRCTCFDRNAVERVGDLLNTAPRLARTQSSVLPERQRCQTYQV
jgi:hypothetical protein